VDLLRDTQLGARVPAGTIKDQHDLLVWAGTNLVREGLQLDREERDGHARRQVKDGAAGGRMDKANEVPPVIAVLDRRGGPRSVETPDCVEDRLQADAVLMSEVDGPARDAGLRVRRRDRLDERSELFLKATCCSGSAKTWRGRGLSRLPSRRTR
jgi:hypothetical protein